MRRRSRQKRRVRHHGHPITWVFVIAALILISAALIGGLAAVGWVVQAADSAPNLSELKPREPHPLTRIYAADGSLLGYVHTDTVFNYVAPNRIPKTLKQATVAIEDRRFWQHGALDYQGIVRAGIKDVFGGSKSLQGASTLTMQLVDNMYMPRQVQRPSQSQVQDRPGQARRAAREQASQELDPRHVSERRPVRDGQRRDGAGRRRSLTDVLR